MQEYTPSIGPEEARRIHRAYTLAREAFGDDIGSDVHCQCELDVPSAVKVAQAVEHINPLFFEDSLAPEWSLRRATRLPIMTGENMELAEWVIPFLHNQAVDIFQPDIINSGGITGVKMIADLAARYRIPIALHNVSGLMLNMASQQLAAAVFNCPRIECAAGAAGADRIQWATKNPIVIKNGYMEVSNEPGLGVELNQDYLKANRAEGEPWWGWASCSTNAITAGARSASAIWHPSPTLEIAITRRSESRSPTMKRVSQQRLYIVGIEAQPKSCPGAGRDRLLQGKLPLPFGHMLRRYVCRRLLVEPRKKFLHRDRGRPEKRAITDLPALVKHSAQDQPRPNFMNGADRKLPAFAVQQQTAALLRPIIKIFLSRFELVNVHRLQPRRRVDLNPKSICVRLDGRMQ
jgi:hypothetical protein